MKSTLALSAGVIVVMFLTVGAAYQDNFGMAKPRNSTPNRSPETASSASSDLSGTLVDAGCANRSQQNLTSAPIPRAQLAPAEPPQEQAAGNKQRSQSGFATREVEPQPPSVTAFGITVDKQTLAPELADVLAHQVQDLYTRQSDSSCAITGETTAFALLTDQGRLLNLSGGSNSWASHAVESSDAGRALLNGAGSSFKPRVVVKGEISEDQLTVDSLDL